ncbi:MAG: YkvI family membrane protein [Cellulosilyticaceae bacterium]
MKNKFIIFQLATIFVGSIVGAGLSSGRELNQFFSTYGYKSFMGLLVCGLLYILVGKMIIQISVRHKVNSYNEFISLVCPGPVAIFTNIVLTLFLVSSTSIILAGSSAVVYQYFGIPRWIGLILMITCSVFFLLRNTKGLFEVNSVIVPILVGVMSAIFIGYMTKNTGQVSLEYLEQLPYTKTNWIGSSIIYAGFNIISIVGILVPLANELNDSKTLLKGVILGTIILTIMSAYITFLMMVNPSYPLKYEIPILAVASKIGWGLQLALLGVIWLEMFSSQISNIYSLTRCLESKFKISYKKGIAICLLIATPFSMIGFSKLVDFLYPLYGVLSLAFVGCCIVFYIRERVSITYKRHTKKKGLSHN